MRVFIGIKLCEASKSELKNFQEILIDDGKLTPVNNLHLTLVFIGEVNRDKIEIIKGILDKINLSKFSFEINRIKKMRDMVIGEVVQNQNLLALQKQITDNLVSSGFMIEKRPYYPHITLARKSNLHLNKIVNIEEKVEAITLFLSQFGSSSVTYQTLYQKALK